MWGNDVMRAAHRLGRPFGRRSCGAVALVALLTSAAAVLGQQAPLPKTSSGPDVKAVTGIEVIFEVQTSSDGVGGSSDDQITILFSNTSSELMRTPPRPIFGDDILAEFSFSGREARPGSTLKFSRRVPSTTFLEARFIRVVNHGADGWAGSTLSITAEGKRLLDRVSLFPRKGANKGGIEKFNAVTWYERTYWEADLQRLLQSPRTPTFGRPEQKAK
jgi:hypothetical protein